MNLIGAWSLGLVAGAVIGVGSCLIEAGYQGYSARMYAFEWAFDHSIRDDSNGCTPPAALVIDQEFNVQMCLAPGTVWVVSHAHVNGKAFEFEPPPNKHSEVSPVTKLRPDAAAEPGWQYSRNLHG